MDLTKKLFGIPVWILVSIAISGIALAAWAAFTSWTSTPTGFAIKSLPDVEFKEIKGFEITPISIDGETPEQRTKDAVFSITPHYYTGPFYFRWYTNFDLGYCDGIEGCKDIYNKTICVAEGCSWTVPDCDPETGRNGETGCRGTPKECPLYTKELSCTEAGCTWYAECIGTDTSPCSVYTDTECVMVEGCEWVAGTGCSGTPTRCGLFTVESDCIEITGCLWDGSSCTGTPGACSVYTTESLCTGVCSWVTDCTGDPTPCSDYTEETSCEKAEGCSMRDYKIQLFYCQNWDQQNNQCLSDLSLYTNGTSVPELNGDGSIHYYILRTTIQPRSCPGTLSSTVTVSSS